jgi:hypothetical protein
MASVGGAEGGGGGGGGGGSGVSTIRLDTPKFFFDKGLVHFRLNETIIVVFGTPEMKLEVKESEEFSVRTFSGDGPALSDPLNLLYLKKQVFVKDEELVIGSLEFQLVKYQQHQNNSLQVRVSTYDSEKRGRQTSISSFNVPQSPYSPYFHKFIFDFWSLIGSDAQQRNWFQEAAKIPMDRKYLIGRSIRSIAYSEKVFHEIIIKITVQEVRNYQDAISQEEISTKTLGKFAYVVLNLIKNDKDDAWKALTHNADGTLSERPIKENIKRFTILSVDNLIRLAIDAAPFKDPRTRDLITSVHKVIFVLDEEKVAPREAAELLRVQAKYEQSKSNQSKKSNKRFRSNSFGGGQTFYKFD